MTNQVEGTDLSYATININYAAMRDSGILFAINKLGQGGYIVDPQAMIHHTGCQSVAVFDSWYYFGDYTRIPSPQAAHHVRLMRGQYGFGQLGCWLDLEYEERLGWGRPSGLNMWRWMRAYRAAFNAENTGYVLGLYTNPDLIHAMLPYLDSTDLAMPLWIAHWTNEMYVDHAPWNDYLFRQEAGDVIATWTKSRVDYDYFNGDIVSLATYAGQPRPLTLTDKVDILMREAQIRGWNLNL